MERLQRIYRLHHILDGQRRPVPLSALQEKLECSRATINRVIRELRLFFNAPIEYDRERNGYHYALKPDETFELPGLWFSAAELYALLTAQQLLERVQPGLLDAQIKPLQLRIEKILAAEHMGSGEIAKRVRILRMTGRNVALGCFQAVASALLQRTRLHISYHGRGNDETRQREVSPQRLTHYRDKTAQAFLLRRLMRRMPRYAETTTVSGRLLPYPQRPAQLRRRTHHCRKNTATTLPRRAGKTA